MNPRASICIATYNGAKYIREQIDSIIRQTKDNDEIIISDDGSIDETINILKSYNDRRIKIFENKKEHGVIKNFENALRHAKGEFIFLCDQDDIWNLNKMDIILGYMRDYDLVVHNALLIDSVGQSSGVDFFSLRKSKKGYFYNLWKNRFLGCCMCFRHTELKRILPFPKHIVMHDMWIGLKIQIRRKVLFTNEVLSSYRRHGSNASTASEKSPYTKLQQLKIRLWMFYYTVFK